MVLKSIFRSNFNFSYNFKADNNITLCLERINLAYLKNTFI